MAYTAFDIFGVATHELVDTVFGAGFVCASNCFHYAASYVNLTRIWSVFAKVTAGDDPKLLPVW